GCAKRFNGAALTRARKGGSRGRTRSPLASASTGPRSRERGRGGGPSCRRCRRQRFNGAALTRARKGQSIATGANPRMVLQRGRAHESAEGEEGALHGPSLDVASTGPRSRERGRDVFQEDEPGLHRALQRGRAHESAEGPTAP